MQISIWRACNKKQRHWNTWIGIDVHQSVCLTMTAKSKYIERRLYLILFLDNMLNHMSVSKLIAANTVGPTGPDVQGFFFPPKQRDLNSCGEIQRGLGLSQNPKSSN